MAAQIGEAAGCIWHYLAQHNVLPVFAQRSCLCVACLGCLESAHSRQGQDSVRVQPRFPRGTLRAELPSLYGLPSLAVACGTTPLTPLTYFR